MPRILVIDDSATIRKVVELAARHTDLDLRFAASGEGGIASAHNDPPDVILLDYVLSDMRGVDVCQRLAADPRTARVPVVLVTAKHPAVRRELAGFPQVVDFVAKPFDATELLRRACAAIVDPRAPARATAPSRPRRYSAAIREQAARALFAQLKGGLAMIPSEVAQLGKQPAAPFFARKLLTPSVVEDLLEALEPILARALAAPSPAGGALGPAGATLAGVLDDADPMDYLRLLTLDGRTGELQLDDVTAYLRDGEVVLCTGRDPAPFEAVATAELARIAPEHVDRARDEQRSGGQPILVTLARLGLLELEPADLAARLAAVGRNLLDRVLARRRLRFAWTERTELPAFAALAAAHLPPLLAIGAPAPGAVENEIGLPPAAAVYDRVPGFSERVRAARLDASARRLLTVVDGKSSLAELAGRSGVAAPRLLRLARDLVAAGLIERRDDQLAAPPVLIYEPDLEGFQRPLESLLRERSEPRALVNLGADSDVVAAIRRERPCLVILSAVAGDERLRETAQAIRGAVGLADLPLVAVLEAHAPREDGGLTAAGFDAVLRKPVAYAEIERFIARKDMQRQSR